MTKNINYFRKLVVDETARLNSMCNKWTSLTAENENIPETIIGDINANTGKAQLLIRERFNQFSKLINDCENKSAEKEIRMDDLQGFWEMIYFQVEDVLRGFDELELMKTNDWKPVLKEVTQDEKKAVKKIAKKPLANYSKVKPTFKRPNAKTQLKPVNKCLDEINHQLNLLV